MSRRPRRKFSEVQKTKAVLPHSQDGVPVSQVCENLGIHPNQYYEWQKQAFLIQSRALLSQAKTKRQGCDAGCIFLLPRNTRKRHEQKKFLGSLRYLRHVSVPH